MVCNTWNKSIDTKHRELDILEYDKLSKETFESIMKLVDQIITDIFDRYTIMSMELQDEVYINEEMINKIMFDVLKETYQCISPQVLDKLTTIYNRTYVDDVIAKKVQMLTMGYVIQVNGTYKK